MSLSINLLFFSFTQNCCPFRMKNISVCVVFSGTKAQESATRKRSTRTSRKTILLCLWFNSNSKEMRFLFHHQLLHHRARKRMRTRTRFRSKSRRNSRFNLLRKTMSTSCLLKTFPWLRPLRLVKLLLRTLFY